MSALAETPTRRHASPRPAGGGAQAELPRHLAAGWLVLALAGAAVASAASMRAAAGWLVGVGLAALLAEMLRRACLRGTGGPEQLRRRLKRGAAARFFVALAVLVAAGAVGAHMPALLAGLAAGEVWFALAGLRALWRVTLQS